MRVLFITTFLPGGRRSGSEVASQGFVDALRTLAGDVTVVAYRRIGESPPMHADDMAVSDRHIVTRDAGFRGPLWFARAVASRQPYSVAKYVTRRYREVVREQLADRRPDVVVVDHAQMGWLVPREGWGRPYVYLAHNIEHRLYESLAEATTGPRRWANGREAAHIRRMEERLCRGADAVWTLTAADADAAREMGASRATSFALPATGTAGPPGEATRQVAILGGWTWKSNREGLLWFLDAVQPLLPRELRVEIGGAASLDYASGILGVTAHGRVPDALGFLQSARVVAVPAVQGAGVQVKTLDAIASGRPVVATPTALRGIDDPPPTVRVAATPEEFAAALGEAARQAPSPDAARVAQEWAAARRQRFPQQLEGALAALR